MTAPADGRWDGVSALGELVRVRDGGFAGEFAAYSMMHAWSAAWTVALVGVLVGLAWRLRRSAHEPVYRGVLAGACIMMQTLATLYWLHPLRFDPVDKLPLHLCDLTLWLAGVALVMPRARLLRSVVFFWGVALSTQAFATPILSGGPLDLSYWFYWAGHGLILAAAVYPLVANGYRPTGRDLLAVTAVGVVVTIAAFVLNVATGWNYFYVGNVELGVATLLDVLGPWPWRVLVMFGVAHAMMAVVWAVSVPIGRWLDRVKTGIQTGDSP